MFSYITSVVLPPRCNDMFKSFKFKEETLKNRQSTDPPRRHTILEITIFHSLKKYEFHPSFQQIVKNTTMIREINIMTHK
jgi:hypothetical protein